LWRRWICPAVDAARATRFLRDYAPFHSRLPTVFLKGAARALNAGYDAAVTVVIHILVTRSFPHEGRPGRWRELADCGFKSLRRADKIHKQFLVYIYAAFVCGQISFVVRLQENWRSALLVPTVCTNA